MSTNLNKCMISTKLTWSTTTLFLQYHAYKCCRHSGNSPSSSSETIVAHVDKQYVQEHMKTDKVSIVLKTKL